MDKHWEIKIEAWPKFADLGDMGWSQRDMEEKITCFIEDMGYQANVSVKDLREIVEGGR